MMGVKVFTATKHEDRKRLGGVITNWLKKNPQFKITDKQVRQSSDNEYHCLSVVLFYDEES